MVGGLRTWLLGLDKIFLSAMLFGLFLLQSAFFAATAGSKVPMFLSEHHLTITDENKEKTYQIKDVEESETSLMMSGAAVIASIILSNFIFGSFFLRSRWGVLCASATFVTSLYSIWAGFRALNEIKWLIKWGIAWEYWSQSRLDAFHLFQIWTLYLAVLAISGYIYFVIKERAVE